MSKSRWLQRSVAVIVLNSQLRSCTSWRRETLSPVDVVAREQPSEIRVQHTDGRSEVLYGPEIRGDSLRGRGEGSAMQSDRALALTDVKGVATRHVNVCRTAALPLGVGAVVGVIIGLGSMQGPLDNWGQ